MKFEFKISFNVVTNSYLKYLRNKTRSFILDNTMSISSFVNISEYYLQFHSKYSWCIIFHIFKYRHLLYFTTNNGSDYFPIHHPNQVK